MQIITPTVAEMSTIQNRDERYYWSSMSEILLRGAGFISSRTSNGPVAGARGPLVLTRGIGRIISDALTPDVVQFYEGPVSEDVLCSLAVTPIPFAEPHLDLWWEAGQSIGRLKYSKEFYRAKDAKEIVMAETPVRWHTTDVKGQFLHAPGWDVLMTARSETSGGEGPVLIARGPVLLCGLPILDIGVRLAAFAPLPGRYAKRDDETGHFKPLDRIIDAILARAETYGGDPVVRVKRWPAGYRAAFSVRHDYDRDISEESAGDLLAFYQSCGVKCSIGFLSYLSPPRMIQTFAARGHEIQLHAHGSDASGIAEALAAVSRHATGRVRGMTIHGGGTGPGFLGDIHYGWAEAAGFDYVEMFADHGCPAYPVPRIGPEEIPARSSLFGLVRHKSLDIDTVAGANRFEFLQSSLPACLDRGEYVILMNHPDIHRGELTALIETLDFDKVWHVGSAGVIDWLRATHYDSTVEASSGAVRINFSSRPAAAVEIDVTWLDGRRAHVIADGTIVGVNAGDEGKIKSLPEPVTAKPLGKSPGQGWKSPRFTRLVLPGNTDKQLRELAEAGSLLRLDIGKVDDGCGPDCGEHVEKWWSWFCTVGAFHGVVSLEPAPDFARLAMARWPLAMLVIPENMEAYQKFIGDKSRNMLRKAARAGYTVRPFLSQHYLDDIFAINTSLEERGGRPMSEGYRLYPKPMDAALGRYCPRHAIVNIGCFFGEKLVAYCNLVLLGEMAIVNRILGHGAHLSQGIMNLLVQGVASACIGRQPAIRAVNYLTLRSSRKEIDRFKKSVGFRPYAVVLTDDRGCLDVPVSIEPTPAAVPVASPAVIEARLFDAEYFTGRELLGLVPEVEDHRNSGFRAIVKTLALPPQAKVVDVGAGGFGGTTTTIHLLDCLAVPVEAVETNGEKARQLGDLLGERVHIHNIDIRAFDRPWRFDLVVLDLDTNLLPVQYREILPLIHNKLSDGGHVICSVIYDCDAAYGGEAPLLNPAGRPRYEAFAREYFGMSKLTLKIAQQALWKAGFAAIGLVDKWMGRNPRMAAGWLLLEKLSESAGPRAPATPPIPPYFDEATA
jgi:hypothetical protein